MSCPACGAEVLSERQFCFHCGAYFGPRREEERPGAALAAAPAAAQPATSATGPAWQFEYDEAVPFERLAGLAIDYGLGFVIGTLVVLALLTSEGEGITREAMKAAGRELWLPGIVAQYVIRAIVMDMFPFASPGRVAVAGIRGRGRWRGEVVANFAASVALVAALAAAPMLLLFLLRDDFRTMTDFVYNSLFAES